MLSFFFWTKSPFSAAHSSQHFIHFFYSIHEEIFCLLLIQKLHRNFNLVLTENCWLFNILQFQGCAKVWSGFLHFSLRLSWCQNKTEDSLKTYSANALFESLQGFTTPYWINHHTYSQKFYGNGSTGIPKCHQQGQI